MADLVRKSHQKTDWKSIAAAELEIGDEITDILKNNEKVTFVVIDHGVIGLKNCLRVPHKIDEGVDISGHGIRYTSMHTYLNEDIYNLLPDSLKEIIKPRSFTYDGETYVEKLWLFSESEIFGHSYWSNGKYCTPSKPEEETESAYEYFKIPAHRVKTLGDCGEAVFWWERTVFEAFSDFFCCACPSGAPGYYHCSNELGICFGFFI